MHGQALPPLPPRAAHLSGPEDPQPAEGVVEASMGGEEEIVKNTQVFAPRARHGAEVLAKQQEPHDVAGDALGQVRHVHLAAGALGRNRVRAAVGQVQQAGQHLRGAGSGERGEGPGPGGKRGLLRLVLGSPSTTPPLA